MNGARYVNSSKDPLKLHTSSQASTVLMGKLLSFLQGLEPPSTVSVPFIHLSRHPPPPFLPLLLLCGTKCGTQDLILTRQTPLWNWGEGVTCLRGSSLTWCPARAQATLIDVFH